MAAAPGESQEMLDTSSSSVSENELKETLPESPTHSVVDRERLESDRRKRAYQVSCSVLRYSYNYSFFKINF